MDVNDRVWFSTNGEMHFGTIRRIWGGPDKRRYATIIKDGGGTYVRYLSDIIPEDSDVSGHIDI